MSSTLVIDEHALAALCRRHRIKELSLFGSVLRDDFGPESDVDLLLVFEDNHRPGIDEYLSMQEDFRALFQREVDLVNLKYLRNPFLRKEVLSTRKVVHAA
jgi:hypothetical protein